MPLAGVCSAALAIGCSLSSPVIAANYTASNDTELRQAILDANADGDPTTTITYGAGSRAATASSSALHGGCGPRANAGPGATFQFTLRSCQE